MHKSFFPRRWQTQYLCSGLTFLVAVVVLATVMLATGVATAAEKVEPQTPVVHPIPGNLPIGEALDIEYGELVRSFERLRADGNNLDSSWNWNHPERLEEVNKHWLIPGFGLIST